MDISESDRQNVTFLKFESGEAMHKIGGKLLGTRSDVSREHMSDEVTPQVFI
jgi:hypothetical protein